MGRFDVTHRQFRVSVGCASVRRTASVRGPDETLRGKPAGPMRPLLAPLLTLSIAAYSPFDMKDEIARVRRERGLRHRAK